MTPQSSIDYDTLPAGRMRRVFEVRRFPAKQLGGPSFGLGVILSLDDGFKGLSFVIISIEINIGWRPCRA